MSRFQLVMAVCLMTPAPAAAADAFDLHTSQWLRKGVAKQKPLTSLSVADAGNLKALSSDLSGHCVVVVTDEGNIAKALVAWGFRRGPDKTTPVLLIERFVTYRADRGDTAAAAGKNVMLFAGFAFNFDIGQVVPAGQGGDVRFTEKRLLEPLEKAKLYGLDGSQLPPKKVGEAPDPNDHDGVLPRDFAGAWKVNVDGRWKGEMRLKVTNAGRATGTYTSADSKSTYRVKGRLAALRHNMKLSIYLDNAVQSVDAFLFTADKSALAGTATLAGRNFGFHATRVPRAKVTP